MKHPFRIIVIALICMSLIACGQASIVTPLPSPSPIATLIPTTPPTIITLAPSATATTTVEQTPRSTYARPTLIPTIDPALIPELLNKSLSVETTDLNGNKAHLITGWQSGFGGGFCGGYKWLDSNHLIFYPVTGQESWGEGGQIINLATQPVVINTNTGHFWLPPSNKSESPFNCQQLDWSPELKILITTKNQGDTSSVSTYAYDGKKLASYSGKLSNISPNRTKILMADSTIIDLQTSKQIKLNWNLEYYDSSTLFPPAPSGKWLYWTSDETRIYACCYFYADLANGTSYYFTESDFLDSHGNPLKYEGLWMYKGQWVLDDTYFLVQWSWIDDGDIRYLPMFNPAEKIIYDVRLKAGISPDTTCPETDVSPNGKFVFVMCYEADYLVNLSNYETTAYPGYSQVDLDWSGDSQYAWLNNYGPNNDGKIEILSLSDKKLSLLPTAQAPESLHVWHPTNNMLVYPSKDKNALIFLNTSTMSYQELLFKDQTSKYKVGNLAWNPNGDKLIFITDSHILWQVDYPSLDNLQQIIASANTIYGAQWSPDEKSISFISDSDIYIVDTTK